MGPPGPFGSIHVKVPPYFELVDVDMGFVDVTGAVVLDAGVDAVGAIVDGDVGDDVSVCAGAVAVGVGVGLGVPQPTTNNTLSRNTDKTITRNGLFISLTYLIY